MYKVVSIQGSTPGILISEIGGIESSENGNRNSGASFGYPFVGIVFNGKRFIHSLSKCHNFSSSLRGFSLLFLHFIRFLSVKTLHNSGNITFFRCCFLHFRAEAKHYSYWSIFSLTHVRLGTFHVEE